MTEHVDAGWSVREFEGLDLGDARLNRRLLTLAEAFGAQPQAPINQASADWQDNGHPRIRQPLLSYPFDGLCSSNLLASIAPAHSNHAPKAAIVPEGA